MERFLGEDFGDVRVHSEPVATRAAAALKAEAFTVGRDIFFGSGKAKFDTPSGMALLGHELTHVSQRRGIKGATSSGFLKAQAEEREASNNELFLLRVLQADREETRWPVSLTMSLPVPPRSGSTTQSVGAFSIQVPSPMRRSTPPMELAKAPIGRPTPAESPAPPAPPPPAEPPAPERREKELDLDALASRVYDLIMRRLTLERERVGYR
jgi:hypothetical protein